MNSVDEIYQIKYRAVIFDLFGTLVDIFSRVEYDRVLREMAGALSVPADDFRRAWIVGGKARTLGITTSPMGSLSDICHTLGISPTPAQLERACKTRLDYYSRNMRPSHYAVEVLSQLKAHGCNTGLISNCATEIHASWELTPFPRLIEAPVFSCSVGLMKPDPRIYDVAVTRLGVNSRDCLYVADGDSGELQGALKAGMDAVRIRSPQETADALRVNEENWHGRTISSLNQVLDLVGGRSSQ
jgi:putative hydrolase of the HAD superfamily